MLERRKSQYKLTERRGAGAGVRRTPTRWSRVSPTSDEHNEPVYCAVGFSDGHRIQVCSWNKFQPVRCYKTSKSFESCSKLEILIDIYLELFDISKYRFMQVEILVRFSLKFVWTKKRLFTWKVCTNFRSEGRLYTRTYSAIHLVILLFLDELSKKQTV